MQILVPVWYPFRKAKQSGQRKSPDFQGFSSSGGGIRTRDLRVMSPTSYQTAPPRGGHSLIAEQRIRLSSARSLAISAGVRLLRLQLEADQTRLAQIRRMRRL